MTLPDPWLVQFEERRKEREREDRSFEFLGETLVHKAMIAPEVGFRLGGFQRRQLAYSKAQEERQERGEEPEPIGVTDEEFLDLCEWTIRSCLEPESLEAWEATKAAESEENEPPEPPPDSRTALERFLDEEVRFADGARVAKTPLVSRWRFFAFSARALATDGELHKELKSRGARRTTMRVPWNHLPVEGFAGVGLQNAI